MYNMNNLNEMLNMFTNKNLYISINLDVAKLIASYTLLNSNLAIDIMNNYDLNINNVNTDNMNNININGLDVNGFNNIIGDNKRLWEFWWLKYVSYKLPKNIEKIGFKKFKEMYIEAIKLYKKSIYDIDIEKENRIENKFGNDYSIIGKNINITRKLFNKICNFGKKFTNLNMNDMDNKAYILEKIYNLTIVYKDLKQLVYLDQRDENGDTILMAAVRDNNIGLIKLLLGLSNTILINDENKIIKIDMAKDITGDIMIDKPNVNLKDSNGYHILSMCQSWELMEMLLENGADINRDSKIFIDLCDLGEINKVKMLLEKGYINKNNIDSRDEYGNTALMIVCQEPYDHLKIIKLLLKYGANINAQNHDGETPLMHACPLQMDTIQLLIDCNKTMNLNLDLNIQDNNGNNVLMYMIFRLRYDNYDNDKNVKIFLENNINLNIINNEGQTAMDIAETYGLIEIIDLINLHS